MMRMSVPSLPTPKEKKKCLQQKKEKKISQDQKLNNKAYDCFKNETSLVAQDDSIDFPSIARKIFTSDFYNLSSRDIPPVFHFIFKNFFSGKKNIFTSL